MLIYNGTQLEKKSINVRPPQICQLFDLCGLSNSADKLSNSGKIVVEILGSYLLAGEKGISPGIMKRYCEIPKWISGGGRFSGARR